MTPAAYITLATIGLVLVLLALTRIPPDVVLFGGLTVLLVSGVLTPGEALAGCGNEGLATVGVL